MWSSLKKQIAAATSTEAGTIDSSRAAWINERLQNNLLISTRAPSEQARECEAGLKLSLAPSK